MSKLNHLASALLLAVVIPACATDGDATSIESEPIATLAGSRLAADLGVSTWEVHLEGDAARIVGLDADGERKAELVAHRDAASAELVHVEAVFPEHGSFDLARSGMVGTASPSLRSLARAITADMGEHSVPVDSTEGELSSSLTQQNEGMFHMGWAFFPYWGVNTVGVACGGTSTRAYASAASIYGAATCTFNGWISNAPSDCRANIYYQIGGWSNDDCRWFVYTQ